MVPGQAEIAKVNRTTGVLYLSTDVWKGLPEQEKQFVLFHEKGHLTLQTADEFKANEYAVSQFLHAGTFTNKDLGQKIMVMRSILDKADGETSPFIAEMIAGAVGPIVSIIPMLGVGSKARQAEIDATAKAQSTIFNSQATATAASTKNTTTIILIAGTLLIVGLTIYFTLRKK